MLTNGQAFWLQFSTIIVALVSPIIAVLISLWYQKISSKKAAKMQLFMDLVSFRDYLPFPWQYSVALNRIDVVFHGEHRILQLWHEYYDSLQHELIGSALVLANERKVALISEIANHLGYNNLSQIFLQRYYQPKGSFEGMMNDFDIKTELLRVLKSTETLLVLGKYEETPLEKDLKEGKIKGKKLNEDSSGA